MSHRTFRDSTTVLGLTGGIEIQPAVLGTVSPPREKIRT